MADELPYTETGKLLGASSRPTRRGGLTSASSGEREVEHDLADRLPVGHEPESGHDLVEGELWRRRGGGRSARARSSSSSDLVPLPPPPGCGSRSRGSRTPGPAHALEEHEVERDAGDHCPRRSRPSRSDPPPQAAQRGSARSPPTGSIRDVGALRQHLAQLRAQDVAHVRSVDQVGAHLRWPPTGQPTSRVFAPAITGAAPSWVGQGHRVAQARPRLPARPAPATSSPACTSATDCSTWARSRGGRRRRRRRGGRRPVGDRAQRARLAAPPPQRTLADGRPRSRTAVARQPTRRRRRPSPRSVPASSLPTA